MKRTAKILLSAMLVLMFVFSFAGAVPAAWADYTETGAITSDNAVFLWNEETEAYDSYTGEVAIDFGKDSDNHPLSYISSIKEYGISFLIPEGLYVEKVTLEAQGQLEGEKVLDLSKYAVLDGSALKIPASAFANKADGSNILDVLGLSDTYVFSVFFRSVDPDAQVEVTYTDGELDGKLGQLFADGDKYTVGDEGHQVKAIPVEKENDAARNYTKGYTGWKLVYPSGISMDVNGGSTVYPYMSCTVQAQWTDAIVVQVKTLTKTYDSEPLLPSCDIAGTDILADGEKVSVSYDVESLTNAGTVTCNATATVVDGSGNPVEGYVIYTFPGTLTVEKAPIVLESKSLTVEYDGQPHTAKEVTITGKTFGTDQLTATATGSITEVGKTTNTISCTITGKEDNYNISLKQGMLRVNPRSLTLTTDSAAADYTGTPLTKNGEDDYTVEGLLEGHKATVTVTGSQTVPGTSDNTADIVAIKDADGKDVIKNYTVANKLFGTLTVNALTDANRIALTIAPKAATAKYDGTAHGASDYEIVSGKLPEGVSLEVTYGGGRTDAGEGETSIASYKLTQSGADVTANFNVTTNTGKITISQRPITITVDSATKEYDSKALTKNTYTVSEDSLLSGHNVAAIEIVGSQTEVGTSKNTIKENSVKITDASSNDVTRNYAITLKDGTLEVTKRPITITADSATKEYDTKPLTKDTADVTSGSLVEGHKLAAVEVVGSQTEVGTSKNTIKENSVKITDAKNNDVTRNYAITLKDGTLEVTGKAVTDITVTAGATKVYDGTALTLTAADIKVSPALPTGYTISATFSASSRTDAGKDDVTLTGITIKDASGENVNSKYNIKVEKGTLEVTKRPLTITTGDKKKVYDGKPLTDRTVPTIEGQLGSHNIELKFTGTQTKVGSSDNSVQILSIKDKETKADVTANYEITYKFGKLTVTSATGTNSGSSSGSNPSGSVQSGDNNNIWIWVVLMVAAAGAAAAAIIIFVRKNKKTGNDQT